MNPKITTLNALMKAKVVAVIRGEYADEAENISVAAIEGGFSAIEVTYTTPGAGEVIKNLQEMDAVIGAGTVLDVETARHAILCGASFIVSPHFNSEVAVLCNRYSVPYLPGCMTVKEVIQALESGCDIVKLFPANSFETSFIKSINGPIPHARIMPTGGIGLNNIKAWLDGGAIAVGIGSDLTKAYRSGGKDEVRSLCMKYVETLNG